MGARPDPQRAAAAVNPFLVLGWPRAVSDAGTGHPPRSVLRGSRRSLRPAHPQRTRRLRVSDHDGDLWPPLLAGPGLAASPPCFELPLRPVLRLPNDPAQHVGPESGPAREAR